MVVRASDNGPARRPQRWTLHSIPIDESVIAAAPSAPDTGPDLEAEEGARVLGGRYVLLELLCHGDLGGVYLGRDRLQNRAIEVKLLSPGAAESTSTVSHLRSRARRMFGIRHAHVAAVYDEALDEDNLPFFVSEHIEGRNLHHMQGDPRLTGAAVQAIALQLAEGLAALHGRSVVHGAVTLGNIVWLEDDTRPVQVKLVDRELSPGNADAPLGMQVAHGYPSPGAQDLPADEAADLYALGAVVYELCTGRPPSPDSEPRVRGEDLPITVTEAFERILLDLIRPDPTTRSAGARALCERLTAVVRPTPPPRPPPAPATPAADEFGAFADEWLDASPADVALTRFRPVEDGPAAAADDEPTALSSAEYTELGPADLTSAEHSSSALAGAPLANIGSTASSTHASSSDVLTAAIASSSAALTGPDGVELLLSGRAPSPQPEPHTLVAHAAPIPQASVTAEQIPAGASQIQPPRARGRLIAAVLILALILVVIWQLTRGAPPAEPIEVPSPTPQTSAQTTPPAPRLEAPDAATLARTHEPPRTTPEPALAEDELVEDAETLPEQLSAGEFRKVLLRANRLGSTRSCYRKHTTGPDRSVEIIAIISPEGRVQKVKMDRNPLADCLRKIILGLDFSAAQKSAQHNFVFHHPDVSQPG